MSDLFATIQSQWASLSVPTRFLLGYALVWLFCMVRAWRFRRLGRRVLQSPARAVAQQPISIVLLYHHDIQLLRRRLPLYLEQQYGVFEVVLVCQKQLSEAEQRYVEDVQLLNPQLRLCLVPPHTIDLSQRNLALTLGVRAARYDWVLFASLDCAPLGVSWLGAMAASIGGDTAVVSGLVSWDAPRSAAHRKHLFLSEWRATLVYGWAAAGHKLVAAPEENLLYSKPRFLQHGGLTQGASLQEGALTLAVNRHFRKRETALCLRPEAALVRDLPRSAQHCTDHRLSQYHVWRRLRCAGWIDLLSLAHSLMTWAHTLVALIVGAVLLAYWEIASAELIVLAVLWLAHAVWRGLCFNFTRKALGWRTVYFLLAWRLHLQPLWAMGLRLAYSLSDKKQYRKRFI